MNKIIFLGGENLSGTHEFGIMDYVEKDKEYVDYEPEKYNCIVVDDDLFMEICNKNYKGKIEKMETFFQSINRPETGIAYYAITLIPPKSLKLFLDIIVEENISYKSKELERLIEKISHAIREDKFLIHFGI